MDLFPTFVHAAGGSTDEIPQLEDLDLLPLFKGGELGREAFFGTTPAIDRTSNISGGAPFFRATGSYIKAKARLKTRCLN